jgi:hypothetical protein
MGDLAHGLDNLERILNGSKKPGKLMLSVLIHITENFSDDRKIGEGGCGHVYKVNHLLNASVLLISSQNIQYY